MFCSPLTAKIGDRLIHLYGIRCAAMHLRNLGISLADAVEILALRAKP